MSDHDDDSDHENTIDKGVVPGNTTHSRTLKSVGAHRTEVSFWHWSWSNIYTSVGMDPLHELLKGLFGSHLLKWLWDYYGQSGLGLAEFEQRWSDIPVHQGIKRFDGGISNRKQLNGTDYKSIIAQIVPIIIATVIDDRVPLCFEAFADIYYLITRPSHTASTLIELQGAIKKFEANRDVFLQFSRSNFGFVKMHCLIHYESAIMNYGAVAGIMSFLMLRDCH